MLASVAQAKGKTSETELQIIQIDQDLSSEVAKDMREVDAKYGEFVERKVTAEDQLKRIDIRAPQDGIVLESKVHTVGGVITAGDTIMQIVPESDKLQVEAKVNPHDIDQVQVGQAAVLRFSAFNQRTTPEINGTVTRVSADTTTDQRTGQSYLHDAHRHDAGRDFAARRRQAHPRHAGRGLRADRRPHGFVLSYQALTGSIHAGVPGKMTRASLRPAGGDFP